MVKTKKKCKICFGVLFYNKVLKSILPILHRIVGDNQKAGDHQIAGDHKIAGDHRIAGDHQIAKDHKVDHDVCVWVPRPVSGVILDSQND